MFSGVGNRSQRASAFLRFDLDPWAFMSFLRFHVSIGIPPSTIFTIACRAPIDLASCLRQTLIVSCPFSPCVRDRQEDYHLFRISVQSTYIHIYLSIKRPGALDVSTFSLCRRSACLQRHFERVTATMCSFVSSELQCFMASRTRAALRLAWFL